MLYDLPVFQESFGPLVAHGGPCDGDQIDSTTQFADTPIKDLKNTSTSPCLTWCIQYSTRHQMSVQGCQITSSGMCPVFGNQVSTSSLQEGQFCYVLHNNDDTVSLKGLINPVTRSQYLWPANTLLWDIPTPGSATDWDYAIGAGATATAVTQIEWAQTELNTKTNVKLRRRTQADIDAGAHWVAVGHYDGNSCYSNVGHIYFWTSQELNMVSTTPRC
jgi:hypothetical protein